MTITESRRIELSGLSRGGWIGAVLAGLFLALVAAAAAIIALLFLRSETFAAAAGFAVLAAVVGWLAAYVLRDARARRGSRIVIEGDEIDLDLRPGRSLVAWLPAVHIRLRPGEIAALETRLEAQLSLGMVNMLRSYALRLHDGRHVVLGEDRALGTGLAAQRMGKAAQALAREAVLAWRDLGMVEARRRPLLLARSAPVSWDAPGIDEGRQAALWRNARAVGRLVPLATIVVLVAAVLSLAQ